MVIVIVTDFLAFVLSDTNKNESKEYQFNGENSVSSILEHTAGGISQDGTIAI